MAITKVINDAVDLNQTSDYSGLRLPVGTTSDVVETFTTDYLVVGGGGGSGTISGAGGAGGLRTSYNNSTTTTNSLNFPSGKTAIATYMLDNNATDISGNYNGTEVNITYNTGKYGGAAIFNGSSSRIDLPTGDLGLGTNNFSISLWFNSANITQNNQSLFWFQHYQNPIRIGATVSSSSSGGDKDIRFDCFVSGSGVIVNTNSDILESNTWYHAVFVKSSTTGMSIYINGVLVASNTSATGAANTNMTSNGTNSIGVYQTAVSASYFNGSIDQVRMYNTALSSTDVSNIYNNEAQANSGGGTAAESSLTLTGGTAYDVTVGAGGAAVNLTGGNNGGSSIFSTITSLGGGFGGLYNGSAYVAPGNGGSGGGGSLTSSLTRGNGTLNQGYEGGYGDNSGPPYSTGGGGGAASPGQNSPGGNTGGTGGSGLEVNIIGGSGNYYAGGGGGAGETTSASGGIGGGGDGSGGSSGGEDGAFNTGGGAGGWRAYSPGFSGGSGVVILRYPTASVSSFTTTGTLNTPSTTNTVADNNYPTTNTAYYQLDGNANGYLTTNDLGTLDYPSGTGCVALYELNSNANGYLTTTDLSTVNYPAGAGCIALYELNGNANDTSNTYNGSDTDITYNTGAFDQAAVFNGSSSYIETPSIIPANNFSFSCWVNMNSLPASNSNQIIYNSNVDRRWYLSLFDGGKIQAWNGVASFTTTSSVITTGQWYNITYTADSTNGKKIYVDGTEVFTTSDVVDNNVPTSGNAWKGFGKWYTNSLYFDGSIDQVRIFNTALTQSQVTTLARGISTSYSGAETNITYNTGAFGQAAVFNGSSSKIELPTSTFSPSTFSLSAWCNVTSDTDENTIIELVDNQTYPNNTNIVLSAGSTGYSSRFLLRNYTTNQYNYNPSGTVSKNVWKHYAMTYDGSTVKSYIDGSLVDSGSLTLSNTVGTISSIQIGLSSGNRHLNGSIDQVRIFNTALTANNITTLARGVGTAYNGTASNVTWANGRYGQAAVFNSSSSNVNIGGNMVNSLTTLSVSLWVNWIDTTNSTDDYFIALGKSSSGKIFSADITNSTGIVGFYDGSSVKYSTGAVPKNTWTHIAITADATVLKIYLNGSLDSTHTISSLNFDSSGNAGFIGSWITGTDYEFDGSIDQVRIYSTALTSSQVTELYEEHYQTKFTDGSDTAIVFTEGTGTVTFSGVDPAPSQGALRTNTSYSEDGSASVIEHYNGTNWKYFDAIKYCTTNTLNFPSGAGCIASYNLDNNVNDIGNTYNGGNSNVTFNASGKFGAAAVFNGSSSKISFSSSPIPNSGAFTVSAWVKTSVSNHCFISFGDFWLKAEYLSGVFSLGDINTSFQGTTDISDENWHHCVLTVDNSNNIALYVDGTSEDTGTSAISRTNGGSFVIGVARNSSPVYWWNGSIDQVRIFNDSLTSDEVSKLYNNEIACS